MSFGHPATTSYGPKMSWPPFSPDTAGKRLAPARWPSTVVNVVASTTPSPTRTPAVSTARIRI